MLLHVVFNEPVHLVVLWLHADVEGAYGILVGESVLEKGVDVGSWIPCVDVGIVGFESLKRSHQRARDQKRSTEAIKTVGIAGEDTRELLVVAIGNVCEHFVDTVMWVLMRHLNSDLLLSTEANSGDMRRRAVSELHTL